MLEKRCESGWMLLLLGLGCGCRLGMFRFIKISDDREDFFLIIVDGENAAYIVLYYKSLWDADEM